MKIEAVDNATSVLSQPRMWMFSSHVRQNVVRRETHVRQNVVHRINLTHALASVATLRIG